MSTITIRFYNFPKKPNSTKTPGAGDTYTELTNCVLIEETGILNPRIAIKNDGSAIDYNYCYISKFGRYYFVGEPTYEIGRWVLPLHVDVMATYKTAIGASTQYVVRSASQYDENIIDSEYPSKTNPKAITVKSDKTIFGASIQARYIVGIIGDLPDYALSIKNNCYNGSVVYFVITGPQLSTLIHSLLSTVDMYNVPTSEISEPLQKQLLNPIQYIHSIKCVPVLAEVNYDVDFTSFKCGFTELALEEAEPPTP